MQIKFSAEPTGDAIAYLAFEGDKGVEFAASLDRAAESAIRRAISAGSFKGGAGQTLEILAPEFSDAARVLVVGVSKKSAASDIGWQKAAAVLVKRLLTSGAKALSIVGAPDRSVLARRLAARVLDVVDLVADPRARLQVGHVVAAAFQPLVPRVRVGDADLGQASGQPGQVFIEAEKAPAVDRCDVIDAVAEDEPAVQHADLGLADG